MTLRLVRSPQPAATLGHLTLDEWQCETLERAETDPQYPAIPLGSYEVVITISPAAVAGRLWSPREDHQLPLVIVPGREGIRIHAANRVEELEGCIAVGFMTGPGPTIWQSRAALIALMERLVYPVMLVITNKEDLCTPISTSP